MNDKCIACAGRHQADAPVPKAGSPVFRGLVFAAPIALVLWWGIVTLLPIAMRAVGGTGNG